MEEPVEVYHGKKFDIDAIFDFDKFLDNLEKEDPAEAKKVTALVEFCADNGPPRNEQKSRDVGDKMFELKTTRMRIVGFYHGAGRIVLVHWFAKPKKKEQDAEIRKAKKLRDTFLATSKQE